MDNIENAVVVYRNGPSSSTLTTGSDNSIMESWQLKYAKNSSTYPQLEVVHLVPL